MRQPQRQKAAYAFTLAELLIALAILGVIATFTIPKVLQAQQDQKYNAIAKEAVSTIASAFERYRLVNQVDSNTRIRDLTPYLNYVNADSSGVFIDYHYTGDNMTCDSTYVCYRLHNGAVMQFSGQTFGGTNATNAVWFLVDPDGVYANTTNGPGKSVRFWLYYNGLIRDEGNLLPNTSNPGGSYFSQPNKLPPWFSWN